MVSHDAQVRSSEGGLLPRFKAGLSRIEGITPFQAGVVVFILGLFTAVVLTYAIRPLMKIDRPLGGYGYDGYLELATNMVHGNGYVFREGGHKVFHRPPLYPALLAPGMLLPESAWRLYVAVLNSVLLGIAAGVFLKFSRLLAGKRAAAIALLLFALNPFFLVATKNAVPAVCQTLAYLLLLYLSWQVYLEAKARDRIRPALLVGLPAAMWLGVMCHGTMLADSVLVLGVLGLWALVRGKFKVLTGLVVAGLLLVAAIAPWTWRNYKVTGMFMPVVGNSGLAYFAGNAHWGITLPAVQPNEDRHQAELRHIGLPPERFEEIMYYYGFTDAKYEKIANARMKEHMREHPGDFAKKVLLNAVEYYFPTIYYLVPPKGSEFEKMPLMQRLRYQGLNGLPQNVFHLVLIILAVAGFVHLWRKHECRLLAACFLMAWAAFALPYFPFLTYFAGRSYYTFGTIPVLTCLAAIAIARPDPGEMPAVQSA